MTPVHILLVEDYERDILLTTEAFEGGNNINKLSVVKDEKKAIYFLTRQGNYANEALPDLLLPDINLPKKNGHEVLQFIKADMNLKQIPVNMLTTSSAEKDALTSYQHYANCYITKPVEVDTFIAVIKKIESFSISIVTLPTKINAK